MDLSDEIDFLIISSQNGNDFGQFIFPKSVLLDKGITKGTDNEGKRGIRVYPSWDIITNKQAEKTQSCQTKYFVAMNYNNTNLTLAKQLLQ